MSEYRRKEVQTEQRMACAVYSVSIAVVLDTSPNQCQGYQQTLLDPPPATWACMYVVSTLPE